MKSCLKILKLLVFVNIASNCFAAEEKTEVVRPSTQALTIPTKEEGKTVGAYLTPFSEIKGNKVFREHFEKLSALEIDIALRQFLSAKFQEKLPAEGTTEIVDGKSFDARVLHYYGAVSAFNFIYTNLALSIRALDEIAGVKSDFSRFGNLTAFTNSTVIEIESLGMHGQFETHERLVPKVHGVFNASYKRLVERMDPQMAHEFLAREIVLSAFEDLDSRWDSFAARSSQVFSTRCQDNVELLWIVMQMDPFKVSAFEYLGTLDFWEKNGLRVLAEAFQEVRRKFTNVQREAGRAKIAVQEARARGRQTPSAGPESAVAAAPQETWFDRVCRRLGCFSGSRELP